MIRLLIDIYYVWKNEVKIVFRDGAVLLLFILLPLFYPLIYTFIYNNEVVTKIPMVVVDESQSPISREFIRKMDGASTIKIMGTVDDLPAAQHKMMSREVNGILYITKDFSKNINTQKTAEIYLFEDMNNLMYFEAMTTATTRVSQMIGAEIRVKAIGPGTPRVEEIMMNPVESVGVNYYNPTGGFASSIIPGVLMLIIQQSLLLGIATLIGTYKDKQSFTIASQAHAGRRIDAVRLTIGKALAYGTSYVVLVCWVLGIVPYLFDLPQIGHAWTLLVFTLPYVLACTFFSMTIAYFCSQREFSMLLFAFTSPLFLFMSGISWPWATVPPMLQSIANIIPSTYGIHGFLQINTMGASLSDVWESFIGLWVLAGVYMLTATLMYTWWIRNYDPLYRGAVRD